MAEPRRPRRAPEAIPEDAALAAFQAAWLDRLDRSLPPEELRREVLGLPEAQPFRDLVEPADPRALELCAVLVKKWGKRGLK